MWQVDTYPKNMAKHNKGSGRRNYLARRRKSNERQEDEVIREGQKHRKLAEVFRSLQETEADETSWERFAKSA